MTQDKEGSGNDASSWSVDDVVRFVQEADPQTLGPHIELFRKHVCISIIRTVFFVLFALIVSILQVPSSHFHPLCISCNHLVKLKPVYYTRTAHWIVHSNLCLTCVQQFLRLFVTDNPTSCNDWPAVQRTESKQLSQTLFFHSLHNYFCNFCYFSCLQLSATL